MTRRVRYLPRFRIMRCAVPVRPRRNQTDCRASLGAFAHYRDLFMWGFGAGVSREAVVNRVRGWGVTLLDGSR